GYYANLHQYFEAYREWLKCNNYYLLNKNFDGLSYTQQVLAIIYLNLKQNESAKKAFVKARRYAFVRRNPRVLNDLYQGISSYWGIAGNYDSSLYYLRLSENYGPLNKIDLSADYNKGAIYFNMGNMENARLFFQKTVNDSYKANCIGYVGVGKYGLGITYIGEDNPRAFRYMKEALQLIDKHNPDLGINICECILDNFKGAEYASLRPFFEKRKQQFKLEKENMDNVQVGKLFNMSSSMNDQLMKTQHRLEQKQVEENKQKQWSSFLLFFGLGVLIILIIVLYAYVIVSRSGKALRLQNEQQKMVLNNSIVTISNYDAMTEGLTQKLKQLALQQANKKLSDELYDLSRNINEKAVGTKSKELKDLDLVIQSVNDGFVKALCRKYPNLTSSEVTLAIYLRMNFSTKQIAELKGTSENSIDVARSRLRTKLGIKGENVDLTNFMNQL
ncbi:MAG: hypothetical protein HYZ43_16385, partial [Flavobacteriia bacterium]|nr:hypothetical protein [Flavobacteriia bacterium]